MRRQPHWIVSHLLLASCVSCAAPHLDEQAAEDTAEGKDVDLTFRGDLETWNVEVVNGKLVAEGDMVLGSPNQSGVEPISAYKAGKLWNVNPIPWRFNQTILGTDDLTTAQKERWRVAVEQWERFTPLRFVEDTGKTASKYINVKDKDLGDPDGCRSEVGMQGWGDPDTDLWVNDCGSRSIAHEIGHAIGLKHEQSRPDRATYVDYDSSCVRFGKGGNFGTSGTTAQGPFNFDSIMMYRPYSWGKKGPYEVSSPNVDATPDNFVFEVTPLFTRSGEGPAVYQDGFQQFDFRLVYRRGSGGSMVTESFIDEAGTPLSAMPTGSDGYSLDVRDGLTMPAADNPSGFHLLLYVNRAAVMSNPNLSGESLADLSNPNYWTAELESDAVDPACPPLTRAGTSFDAPGALYSSSRSMHNAGDLSTLWTLYEASPFAPDAAGDAYGTSVATGDFDGDGLEDAAVAIPGDDTVAIYRGSFDQARTDGLAVLMPWRRISVLQPQSVAVGDFDDDGYDDLAVGSPDANGGAGGLTVLMGSKDGIDRGSAHLTATTTEYRLPFLPSVFTPNSTIATPATKTEAQIALWPSTCGLAGVESTWGAMNDHFGSALHVTDLDRDGRDDLVVGATGASSAHDAVDLDMAGYPPLPGHRATGVVLVLMGHSRARSHPPLEMSHTLSPYTPIATPGIGGPRPAYKGGHAGARFGHSIASADLDADGCPDLVVGAPGDVPSFYGSGTNPEVDGTHLSSTGPRTGRVWGFRTHNGDNGCFRVLPSSSTCGIEQLTYVDYEEPNQVSGAQYGFSVAAGSAMFSAGGFPVAGIVVGAPGSPAMLDGSPVGASGRADVYANPAGDAGVPFAKTPDVALNQSLGGGGPDGLDEPNDAFGFSVAVDQSVILVGAPGDSHGPGGPTDIGMVYRFVSSGGSTVASVAHTSGFTGLGATPGTRYGTFVGFAAWDNDTSGTAGPVIGAPGLLDSEGDDVGAVDWQRGVSTGGGVAFVSPGWLTMVEP